jgi:hypothetical protein
MMQVEILKQHIAKLDKDSFSKLRDWVLELDQSIWYKQLEANVKAGKLDFLVNEATAETEKSTQNNIDTSAIDSLDHVVKKVLLETGMTEDELVEAFCSDLL